MRSGAILGATLALAASCIPPAARADDARPLFEQRGQASWFGAAVEGEKGKSGERVDPDRQVAAHATLPMGSVVRVTRIDNGKSVRVEIIDRASSVAGRVIDLSRRAARDLGMTEKGTTEVKVEAFATDQPSDQVRRDIEALGRK
jgi:rare lipoprotein A